MGGLTLHLGGCGGDLLVCRSTEWKLYTSRNLLLLTLRRPSLNSVCGRLR